MSYLRNGKFSASQSGATNELSITNTSNTASSSSQVLASVAGTSAGDPYFQAVVSGTTTWSWGIDNSATIPSVDPYVISASTALGTTDVMRIATTGEVVKPLQPAFLANVGTTITNITGDGTNYLVIFETEIFDQNSDYNTTTAKFTAPVTGRYLFHYNLSMSGLDASMTDWIQEIITSNRNYRSVWLNPAPAITSTRYTVGATAIADMDAADTAHCTIKLSGSTLTADVLGATNTISRFSGYLIC